MRAVISNDLIELAGAWAVLSHVPLGSDDDYVMNYGVKKFKNAAEFKMKALIAGYGDDVIAAIDTIQRYEDEYGEND